MEENLFLFRRFRTLDQAGKQRVDQQFNAMELTAMQSYVLRYLHDRRGEVVYPKDIEQRFRLTHPTVSGLLARLEAMGLVRRTVNASNKREKLVALTDAGRAALRQVDAAFSEWEEIELQSFTPDERRQYLAFLDRIAQNVARARRAGWPDAD